MNPKREITPNKHQRLGEESMFEKWQMEMEEDGD